MSMIVMMILMMITRCNQVSDFISVSDLRTQFGSRGHGDGSCVRRFRFHVSSGGVGVLFCI